MAVVLIVMVMMPLHLLTANDRAQSLDHGQQSLSRDVGPSHPRDFKFVAFQEVNFRIFHQAYNQSAGCGTAPRSNSTSSSSSDSSVPLSAAEVLAGTVPCRRNRTARLCSSDSRCLSICIACNSVASVADSAGFVLHLSRLRVPTDSSTPPPFTLRPTSSAYSQRVAVLSFWLPFRGR